MTGSRVIGPALAGVLITTVGFGWAFVVDAVSYLAVIECLRRSARQPVAAASGDR